MSTYSPQRHRAARWLEQHYRATTVGRTPLPERGVTAQRCAHGIDRAAVVDLHTGERITACRDCALSARVKAAERSAAYVLALSFVRALLALFGPIGATSAAGWSVSGMDRASTTAPPAWTAVRRRYRMTSYSLHSVRGVAPADVAPDVAGVVPRSVVAYLTREEVRYLSAHGITAIREGRYVVPAWSRHLDDIERDHDARAMGWAEDHAAWIAPDASSDSEEARTFAAHAVAVTRGGAVYPVRTRKHGGAVRAADGHAAMHRVPAAVGSQPATPYGALVHWSRFAELWTAPPTRMATIAVLEQSRVNVAGEIEHAGTVVSRWRALIDAVAIMATSTDPMRPSRWSMEREHAATQLLHGAGYDAVAPDVRVKGRGYRVARRDPAAMGAVARYERPAPMRYGALSADHPAATVRADGVVELLTTLRPTDTADRTREAWRGHRRVTLTLRPRLNGARQRAERDAARVERVEHGAMGKRGRSVNAWQASHRSLPRAVERAQCGAAVSALVDLAHSAELGAVVAWSDGTRLNVIGPRVTGPRSSAYMVRVEHAGAVVEVPAREAAQRLALSGHTVETFATATGI